MFNVVDVEKNDCYCTKHIDEGMVPYWSAFDASHWSLRVLTDRNNHIWNLMLDIIYLTIKNV